MSDSRRQSIYCDSAPDTALDLTVRRPDMDEQMYNSPMINVIPPLQEYPSYQEYSNDYYSQYSPSVYSSTNENQYNHDINIQATNQGYGLPLDSPSPNSSSPPSPGYENSNSPQYFQGYNGYNVLPKKRKNLWRPYDSRNQQNAQQVPRVNEHDCCSDSNSSSDQEFKTPLSPVDPMKRRKRHMLRYAELQQSPKSEPSPTSSHLGPSLIISTEMDSTPSVHNETISSYSSSISSVSYTESRDKMISVADPSKRDVFGWSLKLSQPPVDLKSGVNTAEDSKVCQDGEKTYIELQTVRQSGSAGQCGIQSQEEDVKASSPSSQSQTNPCSTTPGKQGMRQRNTKKQQEKHGEDGNIVGKKVYIQRRDNVVESFDESNLKDETSPSDTKKGITIIDLIEEIENEALHRDKDEQEKTDKQNETIVKLLRQCNNVKLQALDFLMSNVLIEETGPVFKGRNEKVQKILNGDKINSINMLDVVELQVEMALN